ncbi:hypothetical protein C8J57DRAFT_1237468 [Mycena rebaudengoi]|nr:hypothetical protein C8J57DRAFT_1237468 [Mycena rebaudengoi]
MRQFWHTTVACVWVFFWGRDLGNFLRNRAAAVAIWGWVLGLAGGGDLGWGQGEAAAVAATFFWGGYKIPTKSNEKKIGEGGQSAATAAHPRHLPPLPRLVLAGSQKISDLDSAAAVATANLIQNRPINPPATVAAQYWAISSAATAAALKLTPKPAATVAADQVDLVQRISAATAAAQKLTPKPAPTTAADRVDLVQRCICAAATATTLNSGFQLQHCQTVQYSSPYALRVAKPRGPEAAADLLGFEGPATACWGWDCLLRRLPCLPVLVVGRLSNEVCVPSVKRVSCLLGGGVTHIRDEKEFLVAKEAEVRLTDPGLAYFVRKYRFKRGRFDEQHLTRLTRFVAREDRFTGTLEPGTRLQAVQEPSQPMEDVQDTVCEARDTEAAAARKAEEDFITEQMAQLEIEEGDGDSDYSDDEGEDVEAEEAAEDTEGHAHNLGLFFPPTKVYAKNGGSHGNAVQKGGSGGTGSISGCIWDGNSGSLILSITPPDQKFQQQHPTQVHEKGKAEGGAAFRDWWGNDHLLLDSGVQYEAGKADVVQYAFFLSQHSTFAHGHGVRVETKFVAIMYSLSGSCSHEGQMTDAGQIALRAWMVDEAHICFVWQQYLNQTIPLSTPPSL